jgi:hypothetical protein
VRVPHNQRFPLRIASGTKPPQHAAVSEVEDL